MEMSNAVHTTNIHTVYDSPYFNNTPTVERKALVDDYSIKSGQEIYKLLKDKISLNIGKVYPSSMIENDIIEKIYETLGYKVSQIDESKLIDGEDSFTVYTAIIEVEYKDFSILLDQEWEVSESLGLYDKNIILRFL